MVNADLNRPDEGTMLTTPLTVPSLPANCSYSPRAGSYLSRMSGLRFNKQTTNLKLLAGSPKTAVVGSVQAFSRFRSRSKASRKSLSCGTENLSVSGYHSQSRKLTNRTPENAGSAGSAPHRYSLPFAAILGFRFGLGQLATYLLLRPYASIAEQEI